tara:strand:+ start:860 stop:1294 length:435 start_codon:yes stop_codon:yes gene_type:complete
MRPIDAAWNLLKAIPTRYSYGTLEHPNETYRTPGGTAFPLAPTITHQRGSQFRQSLPDFPLARHDKLSSMIDNESPHTEAAHHAVSQAIENGLIDPSDQNAVDNFFTAMNDRYYPDPNEPYIERQQPTPLWAEGIKTNTLFEER